MFECESVSVYTGGFRGGGARSPKIAKAKFFFKYDFKQQIFLLIFFSFKKSDFLLARSACKRR